MGNFNVVVNFVYIIHTLWQHLPAPFLHSILETVCPFLSKQKYFTKSEKGSSGSSCASHIENNEFWSSNKHWSSFTQLHITVQNQNKKSLDTTYQIRLSFINIYLFYIICTYLKPLLLLQSSSIKMPFLCGRHRTTMKINCSNQISKNSCFIFVGWFLLHKFNVQKVYFGIMIQISN